MKTTLIALALLGTVACLPTQDPEQVTLTSDESDSYMLVKNEDINGLFNTIDRYQEVVIGYQDAIQKQRDYIEKLETQCFGQKL